MGRQADRRQAGRRQADIYLTPNQHTLQQGNNRVATAHSAPLAQSCNPSVGKHTPWKQSVGLFCVDTTSPGCVAVFSCSFRREDIKDVPLGRVERARAHTHTHIDRQQHTQLQADEMQQADRQADDRQTDRGSLAPSLSLRCSLTCSH